MSHPLVIAHRGASGERPENTLSAYQLALDQRADMIEIDLHLSLDGIIMIQHDASLARLGGSGEIRDHAASQLAKLNAAPGAALEERMPTLLDVLEGFGDRVEFNLEIKVGEAAPYEGIEKIALAMVEERGLIPRMLFSSFDDSVLSRMRTLSSAARLAVLISPRVPAQMLERAKAVRAEAINPAVRLVDAALVARAHGAGLAVYPYTEDDPGELTRLLEAGVDGIITNHPGRLRGLLERRAKHR